jgi:hypothetical protein
MLDVLEAKQGADGTFIPESVYLRWRDHDFGQKKSSSAYLTAVALGIPPFQPAPIDNASCSYMVKQ